MKSGVACALLSAALFGISTPLGKMLVGAMPPLLLAGLPMRRLGGGLAPVMVGRHFFVRERRSMSLPTGRERLWLGGAIFFAGMAGPVLPMPGLVVTTASTASCCSASRRSYRTARVVPVPPELRRRVALGMLAIVASGVLLSWQPDAAGGVSGGTLLVAGACACWALENNLTRRVPGADATLVAGVKGVAWVVNLCMATGLGYEWPAFPVISAAALLGFVGCCVSAIKALSR